MDLDRWLLVRSGVTIDVEGDDATLAAGPVGLACTEPEPSW